MKKTLIFTLIFLLTLFTAGCGNNDEIEELKKINSDLMQQLEEYQNEETPSESNNSSETDNSNNSQFDKYDILSFELINDNRTSYGDEVIQTYKVTNNSEYSLKEISVTFVYYDADDNIICDDSRSKDILLSPGKSIDIESFSDVDGQKDRVAYSSAVSYSYTATEIIHSDNDGVNYNGAELNLQTKEGFLTSEE